MKLLFLAWPKKNSPKKFARIPWLWQFCKAEKKKEKVTMGGREGNRRVWKKQKLISSPFFFTKQAKKKSTFLNGSKSAELPETEST